MLELVAGGTTPIFTGENYATRKQYNWILFTEGKYYYSNGTEIVISEGTVDSTNFLGVARDVWTQVCNSNKTYGPSSVPCTGSTIDCSSFVTWVLYEYGYTEFGGAQVDTSMFYNTNWNSKYGWQEIAVGSRENPINQLQPGDLFVRYEGKASGQTHHITLVVKIENNRIYTYDCGDESHWTTKLEADNTYDATWFFTASGPGKIIRVTSPT